VLVDWPRVWPPWSLVRAGLPEADYRRRYRHLLHRQTPGHPRRAPGAPGVLLRAACAAVLLRPDPRLLPSADAGRVDQPEAALRGVGDWL